MLNPADSVIRLRAVEYARLQPAKPWMGADSARHYQWYPFVNLGHHLLAADSLNVHRDEVLRMTRMALRAVDEKGRQNPFHVGLPWIWCSNNLATAFATQAILYRHLTGDDTFRDAETSVRDWIFGLNPWGQTMIIMPEGAVASSPRDPHSAMTDLSIDGRPGRDYLVGGIVDGPVSAHIFNSLWGVHLRNADPYEGLHNDRVTYHDDYSDYSTNEPTLDGTAALLPLLIHLVK